MQQRIKPLTLAVAGACAILSGGGAYASGFQLLEQNASGLGNAYAGSAAVAENASTVFFNPAGLTELKQTEASMGVSVVQTSFKFTDNGSSVGALASTGDGNDGGTLGVIPNGYFSKPINEKLTFGVGVNAPFGLATEYNDPWLGGAQALKFDIKTYNINPSLGYRVNDQVSVGIGINWQKIEAEYLRLSGISAGTSLIHALMQLDDTALGWNAGFLYKLSPSTKIGVSYRSKINYNTTGDVKLTSDGSVTGTGTLAALNAAGATSDLKADITTPDTLILSFVTEPNNRWTLLGDLSWTGWSSIPKVDIIRTSGVASGAIAQTLDTDFRDTWRIALGGSYKVNDAWKAKFGIAYDQTPVKSETTRLASLPDNDRIWISVGGQYQHNANSKLDFGLSYLIIDTTRINNNQTTGQTVPRGIVTGSYDSNAWILGIQYSMKL